MKAAKIDNVAIHADQMLESWTFSDMRWEYFNIFLRGEGGKMKVSSSMIAKLIAIIVQRVS